MYINIGFVFVCDSQCVLDAKLQKYRQLHREGLLDKTLKELYEAGRKYKWKVRGGGAGFRVSIGF